MLLVYLADAFLEFNVMGLYLDYLLPVGAMLVGIVAGSGYGMAAWITGARIPRALLWVVILFQCAAYFYAQYLVFERMHLVYKDTGLPVGFFQYFDVAARSFAFKSSDGTSANAMGVWGYAFRFLEVAGFAAAGVIIPLFVRGIPYCESCQRYMRRKVATALPASVPARKIKKSDAAALAAYQEENRQAAESAAKALDTLSEMAASRETASLTDSLTALRPGTVAANNRPFRYSLSLYLCRTCPAGDLVAIPLSGQGKKLKRGEKMEFPIPTEGDAGHA
ncbi:MAG TPA: hypothetical protein VHY22_07415 [Chthoniobacteraceae bacterium]|nr:hypothetical protein [Chthoniobacteraceae bacterium]